MPVVTAPANKGYIWTLTGSPYGTATGMAVPHGNAASPYYMPHYDFDWPTLPVGAVITSATLHLYWSGGTPVFSDAGVQVFSVPIYAIDGSWVEAGSKPSFGTDLLNNFAMGPNNAWTFQGITAYVQALYAGTTKYGVTWGNSDYRDSPVYHHGRDQVNKPYVEITYTTNLAPYAPTLGSRQNFDATDAAAFLWTFSDPDTSDTQSTYQLQIYQVDTATTVVDTGYVVSTAASYDLTAATLTNEKSYQWRVRTKDAAGLEGPWSDYAAFYCSAKPVPTFTVPASDGTIVTTSGLTAEWGVTDVDGQGAYRLKLTDDSDVVLWDSGQVTSSSRAVTIPYTLADGGSYKLKLTVWDTRNVAGTEVVRTFLVSYVPPPTPSLTATPYNSGGFIRLQIANPAPGAGEPAISSNSLNRRESGGTYIRIATGLAENGSYDDYAAASGVTYEYQVVAIGDNGTTAEGV